MERRHDARNWSNAYVESESQALQVTSIIVGLLIRHFGDQAKIRTCAGKGIFHWLTFRISHCGDIHNIFAGLPKTSERLWPFLGVVSMRQNSYVLKSNKNQIRDPKARSMCSPLWAAGISL
jgi:hypothetical protein